MFEILTSNHYFDVKFLDLQKKNAQEIPEIGWKQKKHVTFNKYNSSSHIRNQLNLINLVSKY